MSKSVDRNHTLLKQESSALVMSNNSANYSLEEQHLQELAQTLTEFKLNSMAEIEQLEQQNHKLRRRATRLTFGWLLSIMALAGAGSWAFYRLYNQQQQLASEIASVAAATVELGQIKQLEAQLQDLTKQQEVLPELSGNLQTNQAKISVLNQRIDTLDKQVEQRQETLNTLTATLQNLVEDKQATTDQQLEPNDSDANQPTKAC